MKKESKILIPPENYVADIAKKRPRSQLDKLIDMFGENIASAIMVTFAGSTLHFPNKSTLTRVATVKYIQQELKSLRRGRAEFDRRGAKLSMLFGKSEKAIMRIYKNGKYE